MNYRLYHLEFHNSVHLGTGSLDDTQISCPADTMFSALCHEAIKMGVFAELMEAVTSGKLLFSDAFPYIGKRYFIPKPVLWIDHKKEQGNSSVKKKFKNMPFIDMSFLSDYLKGSYPEAHMNDLAYLGSYSMKVSVNTREGDQPLPYRVRSFSFNVNSGLYTIVGYESDEILQLFDSLVEALGLSGIGGKRSAGYGRFECISGKVPMELEKQLNVSDAGYYMLLSTALPDDDELELSMEDSYYELIRRGGFVSSVKFMEATKPVRKRDIFVFKSGSCFKHPFHGSVRDVTSPGSGHPVYRYACGMFLGVNV